MPKYFFHFVDGGFDPDLEGSVCPNVEAARLEAILLLASKLAEHPEHVWAGGTLRVNVMDKEGMTVATVTTSITRGLADVKAAGSVRT